VYKTKCEHVPANRWYYICPIEWFQLCVESTLCLTITMIMVLVLDSNWFAFLFFFLWKSVENHSTDDVHIWKVTLDNITTAFILGKIIGSNINCRQQEDLYKLELDSEVRTTRPTVSPSLCRWQIKHFYTKTLYQ